MANPKCSAKDKIRMEKEYLDKLIVSIILLLILAIVMYWSYKLLTIPIRIYIKWPECFPSGYGG